MQNGTLNSPSYQLPNHKKIQIRTFFLLIVRGKSIFFVQESGFRKYPSEEMEKFNLVRWKSGKPVDPRLFTVLEMFKKLYVEKHDFFKKIFPGLYDEFTELFNKIGGVSSIRDEAKVRTLTRSLSYTGSHRGANLGDESTLRLGRFRVRTLDLGGVQSSGQGDNKSMN